ncbi:uncharacterized protein LOC119350242 [Triticum dicoccoides]|uniref:uncharacterized protein LOC119350242 n=1 Tax=Triticum dicoccoides TaxID=85692 RepID=UPI00188F61B6|nr:uncharacterized protein LOC119350242 [Triticum dicoccoides]
MVEDKGAAEQGVSWRRGCSSSTRRSALPSQSTSAHPRAVGDEGLVGAAVLGPWPPPTRTSLRSRCGIRPTRSLPLELRIYGVLGCPAADAPAARPAGSAPGVPSPRVLPSLQVRLWPWNSWTCTSLPCPWLSSAVPDLAPRVSCVPSSSSGLSASWWLLNPPCRCPCWPVSIPARLRLRRVLGAASPSGSFGTFAPLWLRSRPPSLPLCHPPGRPTLPTSMPPHLRLIRSSHVWRCLVPPSAADVAPLPTVTVSTDDLASSSRSLAPTAWDCSESRQGEILARSFDADSGDTCGCRHLLGGASMAVICVPLRAAGETLGLVIQIGRRWCLGVVLLHEGAVLFVCGVLGSGFRDVGCHVVTSLASVVVLSWAERRGLSRAIQLVKTIYWPQKSAFAWFTFVPMGPDFFVPMAGAFVFRCADWPVL